MKITRSIIPTPRNFSFWHTVYSHGWSALLPFRVNKETRTFERLLELSDRTLVLCTMKDGGSGFSVEMQSKKPLTSAQKREVRAQLSTCLRLDADMGAFYAEARRLRKYRWIPQLRAGRMLRSPTVFEDVVKMICTTNCSWALTEIMVGNLTAKLGRKFNATAYSFPTPKALAGTTDKFLRKEIRCGYRAPYLLELGERVASGKLDMESWRSSELPTPELFKQLRAVKGMGEYAAGNIMKLLGRYDYLGLDSWVRGKFYELHKDGRKVSDATIERHYAPYGKWQGLFFWLEMTKHWYERKIPF